MIEPGTAIAANRFGLGARPGELARIGGRYREWLLDQLAGSSRTPDDMRKLPSSAAALTEVLDTRRADREARRKDADARRQYGRVVRGHYIEQTLARYRMAAATDVPFYERLVHFWSNHFAVSADKRPVPAIAGLFENEVVRPHIAGRFADLLIAAEQHPAMILYLDNQRSVGPNSMRGRRARERRDRAIGLNENLAREILELHTLGVDGGYSQNDVTEFARVLTGWSLGRDRGQRFDGEPGRFHFREAVHEPGDRRILGKRYRQNDVAQGVAVLRDLAEHPSTARFIAGKLVQHFVADDPPVPLVERLAAVYLESGGELTALYRELVMADEPWQTLHAKYKTPHDFVISAWRALDHVPDNGRRVFRALELLGQPSFRPGSPAGWPDTAAHWGGADALYKRIEWSGSAARAAGSRVDPVAIGDSVLGPALCASTRQSVARAESATQGTTLLLASPDFQRR